MNATLTPANTAELVEECTVNHKRLVFMGKIKPDQLPTLPVVEDLGTRGGVLVALAAVFVWYSVEADRKQCRETGMHRVCKARTMLPMGKGFTTVCTRYAWEPCDKASR